MSASFCDESWYPKGKHSEGKRAFSFLSNASLINYLRTTGSPPSSVGLSVGSKDICYERTGPLVLRADLTAALQMEMRRFVSIIFTLLQRRELAQKIESLCATNGQNSGEQRSGFHRVQQSQEEN